MDRPVQNNIRLVLAQMQNGGVAITLKHIRTIDQVVCISMRMEIDQQMDTMVLLNATVVGIFDIPFRGIAPYRIMISQVNRDLVCGADLTMLQYTVPVPYTDM